MASAVAVRVAWLGRPVAGMASHRLGRGRLVLAVLSGLGVLPCRVVLSGTADLLGEAALVCLAVLLCLPPLLERRGGGGGRAIRGGTLLAGLRRGKEGDRVVAGEQAEEGRGPQPGKRGGNTVSPQPPGPGVDPLVGG